MRVLITGISGTLGKAVTQNLLNRGGFEIIGYSRDELKQSELPNRDKITLYIGDVRDRDRLIEATRNVDIIFHFAALKRVDTIELNPDEGISTNVIGTMNVLHAQRLNGVKRVVLSATDKGAYPINVYGNTKKLAESLVLRNPNNVVCRYGNVIASRGSAIPIFASRISRGEAVPITDMDMTRFFIKIEDAAEFVVSRGLVMGRNYDSDISYHEYVTPPIFGGGLHTPQMKAAKMTDVARCIATILGKPVTYEISGLRPGEKIHECLRMSHEGGEVFSNTAEQFSDLELIDLLRPIVEESIWAS